ncbi:hypothetical protein NFI96_003978 [Prochilodus magdalenae]|nr:hypothetical protein NFI96_003978 [Prochilodus magdalenae]
MWLQMMKSREGELVREISKLQAMVLELRAGFSRALLELNQIQLGDTELQTQLEETRHGCNKRALHLETLVLSLRDKEDSDSGAAGIRYEAGMETFQSFRSPAIGSSIPTHKYRNITSLKCSAGITFRRANSFNNITAGLRITNQNIQPTTSSQQRPVSSVLWASSCGQHPCGQCPCGQRSLGIVLWAASLWAVSLWAASFGHRPVGSILVGSVL